MNSLLCIHPGETLLEDFMEPLRLAKRVAKVAEDIGVSSSEISEIVKGKRAISADMALRLARYFGTSAKIWLRLQARYDLEVAQLKLASRIEEEAKIHTAVPLKAAAAVT